MKALFVMLCGILSSCAIEKPKYESVQKDGNFEVRKYPTIKVVSAPMEGMEQRDTSFRKLFKYISGENEQNKKIAMTSPVFMDNAAKKGSKTATGTMSFMLPKKIAEAGAPKPDGEGLAVTEIAGGTYAVLRFKSWNKEDERNKASESLTKLVAEKNLKPAGSTFFAIYDPPWIPELMRRNEVWQKLEP